MFDFIHTYRNKIILIGNFFTNISLETSPIKINFFHTKSIKDREKIASFQSVFLESYVYEKNI